MTNRLPLRWRVGLSYLFSAGLLLALAYVFYKTWSEGTEPQIASARRTNRVACAKIQARVANGVAGAELEAGAAGTFREAVLDIILDQFIGVEGGFWSEAGDFQGYAFPSYEGNSPKRDVPPSEMTSLRELARRAIATGAYQEADREGRREAVLSLACPVASSQFVGAAWVITRVPVLPGVEFDHLKWFVAALLALVVLHGLGFARLLRNWNADLGRLRAAIQDHPLDALPTLEPSREPDLQPIVQAFNALNARLQEARADGADLARRLAQVERLTMLGQMAAGIAHEIRNPLATLKLKLENTLVDPVKRLPAALPVCNAQIERVEKLVQMLLTMARPFAIECQDVDLKAWLREHVTDERVTTAVTVERWRFDPFHLGRALENVVLNALAFAPADTIVDVRVDAHDGRLVLEVRDRGPGVPAAQRDRLFTPFVSGRAEGTGLGLVLAKEVVEAHGGSIAEVGDASGACFRMEIPWPKS